ncbi:MAG: NAD-dependent epimerase/dehydratase family protein [Fimbriimonadaceae bacterium]|nr:NAD-dependent epimerase/dehydratase family protein [Fimbriimonadaceae bacterium]
MPKTVLITGANGEIGHGLIEALSTRPDVRIVALDLRPLEESLAHRCHATVVGDVTDSELLARLASEHSIDTVFHLAALLSSRSERQPLLAHRVNVDGTLNLLELAISECRTEAKDVVFVYPSSIAVYGLPDLETKDSAAAVDEDSYVEPTTMYGVNKRYCEMLGGYYADHYRQLDAEPSRGHLDFRCIRFPGLISAATIPSGGTSDFGAEMLHAAAKDEPYACFVRADTRIPFMAMPDAIKALLLLEAAPKARLTRQVYNIAAFNPSADEIRRLTLDAFPNAIVTYAPDLRRQGIVDAWPADVDDSAARRDWGFAPDYDLLRAFGEYLVPALGRR